MHTRPVKAMLARRAAAVLVSLLAAGVLADVGGAASAAPKPTVSQVQHRLRLLSTEADRLGEQYDLAKEELASANKRLKLIDAQVARYRRQFRSMRVQIAQIATTAYEDPSLSSTLALLTSGSPQQILDRSSILTELSWSRSARIGQFVAAARQLAGAQQTARRAKAGILTLESRLAARKKKLDGLISRQQALLAQLTPVQQGGTGPGGGSGGGGTYKGPTKTQAEKAVAFAYAQIGKPYVWGATGPGSYDCSGLTMASWAAAGVSIPRTSYEQWAGLPHVPTSQLQPGDILVMNGVGHVAIYVGGGYLIDAPHSGAYVQKVKLAGWYAQTLDGAVRP